MNAPDAPQAAPPGIAALRRATADRHAAIEALLRLDETVARPRYELILTGFESFLSAWEPRVRAALPEALRPWFDGRSRLAFARQDLRALGLRPLPPARAALATLDLPDAAAAFGTLYVLEGSALGGQVIARRLTSTLGLDGGHGAAYFAGWGSDTGGMWREFRERLETQLDGDAGRHSAGRAARQTFDALIAHFTACLRPRDTGAEP